MVPDETAAAKGASGSGAGALPREFCLVGRYKVLNGAIVDFQMLDEDIWKKAHVVYARVYNGDIVYMGKCDGPFGRRFKQHLKLFSADVNEKYRKWAEGKEITIMAYKPPPVELLGEMVQIHGSIEAHLIAKHRPKKKQPAGFATPPWFVKKV